MQKTRVQKFIHFCDLNPFPCPSSSQFVPVRAFGGRRFHTVLYGVLRKGEEACALRRRLEPWRRELFGFCFLLSCRSQQQRTHSGDLRSQLLIFSKKEWCKRTWKLSRRWKFKLWSETICCWISRRSWGWWKLKGFGIMEAIWEWEKHRQMDYKNYGLWRVLQEDDFEVVGMLVWFSSSSCVFVEGWTKWLCEPDTDKHFQNGKRRTSSWRSASFRPASSSSSSCLRWDHHACFLLSWHAQQWRHERKWFFLVVCSTWRTPAAILRRRRIETLCSSIFFFKVRWNPWHHPLCSFDWQQEFGW